MPSAPAIPDADEAALAELRELGLAAAREGQARLAAAEGAEEFAQLSLAFGRLSRSVRQTIALTAKLRRDAERAAREAAKEARAAAKARIERRRDQVRAAVLRRAWAEAEDMDAFESLRDDLDELLAFEAGDAAFTAETIATQIAHACAALHLTPPSGAGEATEGAATAHAPSHATPQSLRDSSPNRGASDELLADDYWRSSA